MFRFKTWHAHQPPWTFNYTKKLGPNLVRHAAESFSFWLLLLLFLFVYVFVCPFFHLFFSLLAHLSVILSPFLTTFGRM